MGLTRNSHAYSTALAQAMPRDLRVFGASPEMEKEAIFGSIGRSIGRGLSNVAVKMGLKPSFREMLKIRRGLNVTQDLQGGGARSMNGVRGAATQPLETIAPGNLGHYSPDSKQVRVAAGAGRDTLRHELMHAYQFEGRGLMRRMADWRSAPGAGSTFKGSIGNAMIEAQAQMAGNRGILKGLKAWGQVAPQYAPYYNATGAAALPYQASRAVGQIAASPVAAAGVVGATGLTAAGAATAATLPRATAGVGDIASTSSAHAPPAWAGTPPQSAYANADASRMATLDDASGPTLGVYNSWDKSAALTKSANVFLAVGDLLRTMRSLRGVGLGKVEHALTNPVAMGRRSAVENIGKAVAAPVLAPALGVMGVASKVDHAAKAHDPLRLLQMRSREAAVKGMSNRPVDRRQFVTDMMRGLLNPDVRQAVGTLGTAAVRGAATLAEKIASMEKQSAAEHDGLSVSEGVVNPLRIGADSFVGYKALKGAARTLLNPSEMYHGTSTEHLPGIIRDGLKPHNNVDKWVALKAEEIGRLQDASKRNGVPENLIQRDVAEELTRLEKIKQNLSTPKTFLSKGFFGGKTEAKSYAESAAHATPGSQGVVLSTTLTPDELRRAVPDVITSRPGAWNKPDIHNFSVDWTIPSRRVYKGTPSLWALIRGRSPEILKNLKANGAFRAAFGLGALGVAGLAGLDAVRTGKRTADKLTQEKSAAEAVRKPRTEYDEHCPHCDRQFTEKGGPRRKHNGESDDEWKAGFDSGDYDEHCPHCDGIVDRRELTDDEIESNSWADDAIKEDMRRRRETYRKRKAAREVTKSAAAKCPGCGNELPKGEPLPDVTMCEVCERYGPPRTKSASTIREALQSLRRAWQGAVKAGPNLDGMFDAGAGHILTLPARGTDKFTPHISNPAGMRKYGESLDDLRKVWRGGAKSDEWLPLNDARDKALFETVISPPDIVSRLPESQLFRVTEGLPNRAVAQEVTSGGRIFKGIPRPGVIATAGESKGIPGAIGQLLDDRRGFRKELVDGQWFTGLPSVAEGYAASNGSKFLSPRAEMPTLSWDRVDVNARELADRIRAWHSDVTEQFKRPYQRLRSQLGKSAAITPFEKLARYRRIDHARPNPSQAQIESQNFKMGHVDFHGIDITIENEKGSIRRGTTKEGKKWESVLTCPYGYIRSAAGGKSGERVRPKAIDGDHLDVFVGPNKASELVVVIDQYLGGKYDESKFLLGCDSQDEGVRLYRSNYQRGWPDMPASTCTFAQFKEWLKNGDHKKPFAGQMVKAAAVGEFLKGDNEGLDWRWGLLGGSMVQVPAAAASLAYATRVAPWIHGAENTRAEQKIFNRLSNQAVSSGVRLGRVEQPRYSAANFFKPAAPEAFYHEPNGRPQIGLSERMMRPGALAHELGHAQGGRALFRANLIGARGMLGLGQAGLFAKDETTGRNIALAGTAFGGATLASELDAGRRGYKSLRALGSKRLPALKSFAGLPTYLMAAAMPLVGHYAKKWMGGYDKPAAPAGSAATPLPADPAGSAATPLPAAPSQTGQAASRFG